MKHSNGYWAAVITQFTVWLALCNLAHLSLMMSVLFLLLVAVSDVLGGIRVREYVAYKNREIEEPKL